MHIEFVTDTYTPDVNGAAKTLAHLVRELNSLGHEVTVLRTGKDPQKGESVVPFFMIPGYPEIKIGLIRTYTLAERWRNKRPDVIYVGMESPMGCAAARVAKSVDIPVIAGFHTNFHQYCKSFKIDYLTPFILKHIRDFHNSVSATVVPSLTVKEQLDNLDFERLYVMGRGVDVALFDPQKRSDLIRADWGAESETPVAIYVGRMSPEKNLDLVAKAFYRMRQIRPDTVCVVVGDGPVQKKFENQHPEFIHCKYLHGEELATAYASADIMVFPSISETFGNTVTESLASGLVTVAYDYASAKMHLKHGVNGVTARYDDEEDYLKQIEISLKVFRDENMRGEARRSVESLSWKAIAERLVEIAEQIED